jgi:hypothetical protein
MTEVEARKNWESAVLDATMVTRIAAADHGGAAVGVAIGELSAGSLSKQCPRTTL